MSTTDHSLLRDISGAAYMSHENRNQVAREHGLHMLTNKGELSAYKSDKDKKVYVAHRGTNKKKDLSADVAIAFGMQKYHPRFKRAKRESRRLQRENPGYQIVHTGHSLGGSLAEASGNKKSEVVTFNKGAGLLTPLQKRKKNQTDYINKYDPVSLTSQLQKGGKVKKQAKFSLKSHPHDIKSSTSTFF